MLEAWQDLSLQDREGEIWIDIHDYKGIYQVSNHGRIKSLSRWRKNNTNGYFTKDFILRLHWLPSRSRLHIALRRESRKTEYAVARIVFANFNDREMLTDMDIRHLDGNAQNNHLDNLFVGNHTDDNDSFIKRRLDGNKVRYKGVSDKDKNSKILPYRAYIRLNKHHIDLGTYATSLEAAKAYDAYILEHMLKRKGNFIDNRLSNIS